MIGTHYLARRWLRSNVCHQYSVSIKDCNISHDWTHSKTCGMAFFRLLKLIHGCAMAFYLLLWDTTSSFVFHLLQISFENHAINTGQEFWSVWPAGIPHSFKRVGIPLSLLCSWEAIPTHSRSCSTPISETNHVSCLAHLDHILASGGYAPLTLRTYYQENQEMLHQWVEFVHRNSHTDGAHLKSGRGPNNLEYIVQLFLC